MNEKFVALINSTIFFRRTIKTTRIKQMEKNLGASYLLNRWSFPFVLTGNKINK